jgi:DNA-directed RNA polymerase specialized sigma24 family protein
MTTATISSALVTVSPAAPAAVDAKPVRQRKAVVAPKKLADNISLFDYLSQCQPPLVKKIIDIACSQTQVPPELKKDAGQEIMIMWSTLRPDTDKYKPGQIAAYAHQMARHAALRTRRELGSSVRLPGSAFRKRKDGSSYVTPGVLAAALDWNEMENWFNAEDGGGDNPTASGSSDFGGAVQALDESAVPEEDSEEAGRAFRLDLLKSREEALTPRQFAIMASLIEGATYEEIQTEQGIKKGVLMREVAIAGTVLGPMEF